MPDLRLVKSAPVLRIIGVAGYKGSGKDSVARCITGRFSALSGMHRVAFADTLREAVAVMYGFTLRQMLDPVLKERVDPFWGISPRDALRVTGTDCMRKGARQDFWLKALERRMHRIMMSSIFPVRGFVIPDVRFPNELDFIRSKGGECWVIYRPGHDFDGHATEELPRDDKRFDIVLHNSGSRADLKTSVRTALNIRG